MEKYEGSDIPQLSYWKICSANTFVTQHLRGGKLLQTVKQQHPKCQEEELYREGATLTAAHSDGFFNGSFQTVINLQHDEMLIFQHVILQMLHIIT